MTGNEDLKEKYAMTLRRLKNICIEREGYEAPHLNEVLELQYKGFSKIENLDHYPNVHALFLQQNSIPKIEGLDRLIKLKCLYLSKNRIAKIENISHLTNLCHLDLSHNPITKVEGLANLSSLELLKLAHCRIESLEDLSGLAECQTLQSVDVTHNEIHATDEVPAFWGRVLPDLQCLYYNGNPGLRTIKQYRRRLIGLLPKLRYLDERPIFEDERAYAEAWNAEGPEGEQKKRQEWHEKKLAKEEEDRKADEEFVERAKALAASGGLPKHLPTVTSTEHQSLSELWEDLRSQQVIEVPDTPEQQAQDEPEQHFDFEPPARVEQEQVARVEEVLVGGERSDGSWQMLAGESRANTNTNTNTSNQEQTPSESGGSVSNSEPPSELSSQRQVGSEAPTGPGGLTVSNPPSTINENVACPWMWSHIRDRRLQNLAALHNHSFSRAAATLSHEFGDVISEAECRKRYGLLIRGTAPVLDNELQERDRQFYYRRMRNLDITTPTNVNVHTKKCLLTLHG